MIVINIWLWLHSFLSALDASLGSKIIQTFALPCCCVVDRSANEESIHVANNFITRQQPSQLRHLPPGFFERWLRLRLARAVALLLRARVRALVGWSAGRRLVAYAGTSEVGSY